jgi:hypothetical protein
MMDRLSFCKVALWNCYRMRTISGPNLVTIQLAPEDTPKVGG